MNRALAILTLVFAASLTAPRPARACATAPPQGAAVSVADESALIIWDEATKTEHFIRRATFRSEVKDFGFLVPTPTRPTLSETSETVFMRLEDVIRPEVVQEQVRRVDLTALLFMFFSRSMKSGAVPIEPVRVLEETRVAGYDAAVLEADDAGALEQWLKQHGYAQRPALAEWLQPYVQKKWKLTAFKVADPGAGEVAQVLGTTAVKMSFQTDRPFFPYREPRDQRESQPASHSTIRSLRVFFVGSSRVSATIGEGSTKFPGVTEWAGPLAMARDLPVAVPPGAWLTVFQDDAAPRPGTDELWFDRSKDQEPRKPPPTIVRVDDPIRIPLDVVLVVGIVGLVVHAKMKRKKEEE